MQVVERRLEQAAEISAGWTYSELPRILQRDSLNNFIHNDNPALTILAIGISRASLQAHVKPPSNLLDSECGKYEPALF